MQKTTRPFLTIDYLDWFLLYSCALRSGLRSIRNRLRGTRTCLVVLLWSFYVFCGSFARWNGWKASAKDRKFLSGRPPLWSWMRFVLDVAPCLDDDEDDATWKWPYYPFDFACCDLVLPFLHPRGVLYWRALPRALQRGHRRLSIDHSYILSSWLRW